MSKQHTSAQVKKGATVEEFMIKDLVAIDGELPVTVACRRFLDHKVGSLLVLLPESDYACLTKTDIINVIGKGEDPGLVRTRNVASHPIKTCAPATSLEDAMLEMSKHNITRLFVVGPDDNKPVGVISSSDILRIAPGLLEIAREESFLRNATEESDDEYQSGYCDDCKQFSEYLKIIGGFAYCKDCLASQEDEEEDQPHEDSVY